MSSIVERPVVTRLAPFVALLLARWYDREIALAAQRHASSTFDMLPGLLASALGSVLAAGLVLAVGLLAWRSRSVAVGLGYALVGGVVVFDQYATFAIVGNAPGAPSGLMDAISSRLYDLWSFLYGPLGIADTVAAGMLVAGAAVMVRAAWERRRATQASIARPAHGSASS